MAHPCSFLLKPPGSHTQSQLLTWHRSSWRKREASKPEPSCGPTMICDLACASPSLTEDQVSWPPWGPESHPSNSRGPHSYPSVSSGTFRTQSFSITHLDKKSHLFVCSPLWLPPSLLLCTENLASAVYGQYLKPLSFPSPPDCSLFCSIETSPTSLPVATEKPCPQPLSLLFSLAA